MFGCKHLFTFHRWEKWQTVQTGAITNMYAGRRTEIGSYISMQRVCSDCGLLQLRDTQTKIK